MNDTEDSESEGTVIEGEGEGRIIENESLKEDGESAEEAAEEGDFESDGLSTRQV